MQQRAAIIQDGQALEVRLNWSALEDLVLLRLLSGAPEGETEVQLRKDLHPLVMQHMSVSEWRTVLGQLIVKLVEDELVRPVRANAYLATEQVEQRILSFLSLKRFPKNPWHEIRDGHLIALALNQQPTSKLVSRLISAEGLRCAIIADHFRLPVDLAEITLEQLRFALAKIAEQKGLTSGIRTTPIDEASVTHKEAVMMGAKLLKSRHAVESDGELMACLAAELVGAINESSSELRQMLFRRLITPRESTLTTAMIEPLREQPPELPEFTQEILTIAAKSAVGWPGNKRAFISHVWRDLQKKFPFWQLTESDYKNMILSAHRAGLLRLAIADLRDKNNVQDVSDSRISYKNSEWHFIRIDETNE